jgi:hypothetical protein
MPVTAVIRILCEADPSLGTAVVNGLLAWSGVLGGCTIVFSGLPAAAALSSSQADQSPCRDGSTAGWDRACLQG